jgi:hypothetical protein
MVHYINFVSLDVSVIFSCICVDLKDLDGGSEIRMGSDLLFCVFCKRNRRYKKNKG